jgi:hypothetical protein
VKISGAVQDTAELGVQADKSTQFPLTIALTSSDPMVRIGLRCKLFASRTIPGALSIPATAVKWENGQTWCNARTSVAVRLRSEQSSSAHPAATTWR